MKLEEMAKEAMKWPVNMDVLPQSSINFDFWAVAGHVHAVQLRSRVSRHLCSARGILCTTYSADVPGH